MAPHPLVDRGRQEDSPEAEVGNPGRSPSGDGREGHTVDHDEHDDLAPAPKPGHTKIHPGPGFRLRFSDDAPDAEVLAGFRAFETPEISDMLNRLYTVSADIRPM